MGTQSEVILGYPVYACGGSACLASITEWIEAGNHPRWLACLNPHSYAEAENNPAFSGALRTADWLIPDGIGVVLASRAIGGAIKDRITGSDIFLGVLERMESGVGCRAFFLGSTECVLGAIRRRVEAEFRSVTVVGTYSPPFKSEFDDADLDKMIAAINSARPDVLWVGMTAPKQELWIKNNIHRLATVKFVAAIGAVFDFYSGRVRRASPVLQRFGLEWLTRFLRQPRRLWRRTLVSAPLFCIAVGREVIRLHMRREQRFLDRD